MDEEGISIEAFKEAFEKGNLFASGIGNSIFSPEALSDIRTDSRFSAVNYGKSSIVAKPCADEFGLSDDEMQSLAPEIKLGMRIPSVKVLNQSDARPWHLQELLRSNGTWRVILFPGDIDSER